MLKLVHRIWYWVRQRRAEADLLEEIEFHRAMRQEQLESCGMPAGDAAFASRRALGNITLAREDARSVWLWPWLESAWQDARHGARGLMKNPGYTIIAVLTLALGIGANTEIFSIVNAVFLRPLPFPNAGRVYVVDRVDNQVGGSTISFPIYLAWQKRGEGYFEHLALLAGWGDATVAGSSEAERVPIAGASAGILSVLGVQPALGRDFLPEESRPGGPKVTMLSDGLWRSRFGADANVLGRTLTIDGAAHTVVGVLPRGFQIPLPGMRNAELFLPIRVPRTSDNAANGTLLCLGLLHRGVAPAAAVAALTPALSDLRRTFPKMFSPGEKAHLAPLRAFLADRAGTAPLLLFGAVGLVLLIACANVANLTLARSANRRREIAVRSAIGAGRARVVRQLLTESLLLALLGGIVGVGVCLAGYRFILTHVPADLPHVGAFRIDWSVLIFALGLSAFTGVAFGLVPALAVSRGNLNGQLKDSNPRAGSEPHTRLRSVLAASQVSISLVLLIGAALTLESLAMLMRVRPGFDPEDLLTFHVSQRPNDRGTIANRIRYYDRAMARIRALPDVEHVGLISTLPFEQGIDLLFTIEGRQGIRETAAALDADFRAVSPGLFPTMHVPLLRGREFSDSDHAGSNPVVIINQAMARRFWPDQDPIGQRVWIGKPMGPEWTEPWPREVVGVIGDIHGTSLAGAPNPTMYVPYAQRPIVDAHFVIRTRQSPSAAVRAVRAAMREVDPDLPLARLRTMEQVMSVSIADWRFRAILLTSFGAVALLIAAIGIYGVISYSAAQRTHEIGIRLALGARSEDVRKLVVGEGFKLTLVGLAVGIAGGLALTRLLANLLYGVSPTDPLTLAVVSSLLAGVALLASYIPARRAARLDPLAALRHE